MDKRQITENLICESFKSMILKYPFEKITIKMITDNAGIIRPTFYNYFQDKYELLECYLKNDIMDSVNNLISNGMEKEAVKMIFVRFDANRAFYKKVFEIQGQNSFESILTKNFEEMFKRVLSMRAVVLKENIEMFTIDGISSYYTNGLVYFIKSWLNQRNSISVEEILQGYIYIISHSLFDIMENKKDI